LYFEKRLLMSIFPLGSHPFLGAEGKDAEWVAGWFKNPRGAAASSLRRKARPGSLPIALVACIRKLTVMLNALMRTGQEWSPPELAAA
jgi:hypothetical protein